MINMMFLLILFSTTVTSHRVDGNDITMKEDFELERHLKLINKPPIKSIQTDFGYIVDCVDIKKQPAFDHPLLKNHKLQTRPSFYSEKENKSINISPNEKNIGLHKVTCPKGFVPIRRTTKEDLIRNKSLWNNSNILVKRAVHKAEVYLKHGQNYYGIFGTVSVYNPMCSKSQASSTRVYVRNGFAGAMNEIVAGWQVFPDVNGNDRTYSFASWTSDNFQKTGCYNLECQGFVQINREYHIGAIVPKTSDYDGNIVEMPITIVQDERSKNWWISIFGKVVGYYPQALFNNLKEANQVGWGGATIAVNFPSPQMGSGHVPDQNYKHTCYFKNIGVKNRTNSIYYGPENSEIGIYNDAPNCFKVDYYAKRNLQYGYSLQFGGPGGSCIT